MQRQLPSRTPIPITLSADHIFRAVESSPLYGPRILPCLRHRILREAFGDMTIHVDFSPSDRRGGLRPGPAHRPYDREISWDHAGIRTAAARSVLDRSKSLFGRRRPYTWFGCVCHRYDPQGPRHIRYGRRQMDLTTWTMNSELHEDLCLRGGGRCGEQQSDASDCSIGALGWLLTCRAA